MFKNYLKISLRSLTKRKGYTIINILGLAIGMTCCLLIFQYVAYERSYDQFNSNAKDIVRLRLDNYRQGQLTWRSATVYPAIAPALKTEFPDIEEFCRMHSAGLILSSEAKNAKFNEKNGYYADAAVIDIMDLKMTGGKNQDLLNSPDKMIVSESFSKKYFGDKNPVGQVLSSKDPQFRFQQSYIVTGVFKDNPPNSHLKLDYLISYPTLSKMIRLQGDSTNSTETSWEWYDFYTYLKLRPNTDQKKLESSLSAFCDAHINNLPWEKANNVKNELHILPIADIHLKSNFNEEAGVNGDGETVSFLFLIGIFIIAIAWINYINLATARSVERAREVGVRKVLGAGKSSLVRQFLIESWVLNLIALGVALITAYLLLPGFNHFAGRETSINFTLNGEYLLAFAAIFICGSFLAGLYPAFVLSGYQPIKVLKGNFKNTGSGIKVRKALITSQFVTSIILVAGTIIVYQQISYMRNQKLGTNISQTIVLEGAASLRDTAYSGVFPSFREDVLRQSNIKSITSSTSVMGNEIFWTGGVRKLNDNASTVTMFHVAADYDFIPSFGINIKAGRNFSKDFATDNKSVLLNEEAAKLLGFVKPESAINQRIIRGDTLTIVGVVANFHQEGLKKAVPPLIILLRPLARNFYSVKIGPGNTAQTIANLKTLWDKYFPADPFNYSFLDEAFDKQYKSDELFGKIFSLFSLLAIAIACFGLAGLAAYNVIQRAKEIGIRKIMGASTNHVVLLLLKDFVGLAGLAFLIAIPVTWLLMDHWLQTFAYRTTISWLTFAMAGIIVLFFVMVTISLQAVKAALANPVKSLRSE